MLGVGFSARRFSVGVYASADKLGPWLITNMSAAAKGMFHKAVSMDIKGLGPMAKREGWVRGVMGPGHTCSR